MIFEFVYSNNFNKHYKKRIQGTDRLFESSANMDVRIIWYYEGNKLIALVDVGHHDILKQF